MDMRISKVEASVVLNESSKRIGPGQQVNLDESFDKGTLRDVLPEEFFEPVVSTDSQPTVDESQVVQPRVKAKKEKA